MLRILQFLLFLVLLLFYMPPRAMLSAAWCPRGRTLGRVCYRGNMCVKMSFIRVCYRAAGREFETNEWMI